jgi:hypothetical protein
MTSLTMMCFRHVLHIHSHTIFFQTPYSFKRETHLWLATPPTASEQPIPHTGATTHHQPRGLHKGDPTLGSRVIHIIYTGEPIPHIGWSHTSTAIPTPMKLKNGFDFGPPQARPVLLAATNNMSTKILVIDHLWLYTLWWLTLFLRCHLVVWHGLLCWLGEADQPRESPTHSCKNDLVPNYWTNS